MHIERLDEIASWLEDGAPHRGKVHAFTMSAFIDIIDNDCGTACCIAGAAVQFHRKSMKKRQYEPTDTGVRFYRRAKQLLDLDETTADNLFIMENTDYHLNQVTPAWAARCIRNLIETGEVDWDSTREG
jgi:hypothetical protein